MSIGATALLYYTNGMLRNVRSPVRELAAALAPRLLPRPFSGTVTCRLRPMMGQMALVATSYTLDGTPLMNTIARRRMLEALGFQTAGDPTPEILERKALCQAKPAYI